MIDSQTAKGKYDLNNSIKFEAESIKSSLFDYPHAFILVTGEITATANNNTNVDKANHIYMAMPLYNLIEGNDNYSDT